MTLAGRKRGITTSSHLSRSSQQHEQHEQHEERACLVGLSANSSAEEPGRGLLRKLGEWEWEGGADYLN